MRFNYSLTSACPQAKAMQRSSLRFSAFYSNTEPALAEFEKLQKLHPTELLTLLNDSKRLSPIGTRRYVHVYPLKGFPHLLLRAEYPYHDTSPLALKQLCLKPVAYQHQGTRENPRYGIPLGAIIPSNHPDASKQQLMAKSMNADDLSSNKKVHLTILRKSEGNIFYQNYYAIRDLMKCEKDHGEQLYERAIHLILKQEKSRSGFLWFMQECSKGDFLFQKGIYRNPWDSEFPKRSTQKFIDNHQKMIKFYLSDLATLSKIPQPYWSQALHDIKNCEGRFDFSHCKNFTYDVKNGFSFFDIGFNNRYKIIEKNSLFGFICALLGSHDGNLMYPHQLILDDNGYREFLKLARVVLGKLEIAAKANQIEWPRAAIEQYLQLEPT